MALSWFIGRYSASYQAKKKEIGDKILGYIDNNRRMRRERKREAQKLEASCTRLVFMRAGDERTKDDH